MSKEYENAEPLIQEAEKWGVPWKIERGSKHLKFVVEANGQKRTVVYSTTKSEIRAMKNNVSILRRYLSEIKA